MRACNVMFSKRNVCVFDVFVCCDGLGMLWIKTDVIPVFISY